MQPHTCFWRSASTLRQSLSSANAMAGRMSSLENPKRSSSAMSALTSADSATLTAAADEEHSSSSASEKPFPSSSPSSGNASPPKSSSSSAPPNADMDADEADAAGVAACAVRIMSCTYSRWASDMRTFEYLLSCSFSLTKLASRCCSSYLACGVSARLKKAERGLYEQTERGRFDIFDSIHTHLIVGASKPARRGYDRCGSLH
jgi:hypothetical protein